MAVAARQRTALPSLALVRRELLTELRRPRAFGVICGVAIIALAIAVVRWPTDIYSLNLAAWMASRFFVTVGWTFFGVMVIVLPALSANAIVLERERETFDLVRMSLVTSTGFVLAKFVNAMGVVMTVLLGVTPVIGTVFFLAGIDVVRVVYTLILLATVGMTATSVALWASSRFRRSLAAIVASYAGLALVTFVPVFTTFFALSVAYNFGFTVRSFGGAMNFVFTNTTLLGSYGVLVWEGLPIATIASVVTVHAALSAGCLALAIRRVHQPMPPPRIEEEKPIEDAAVLAQRRRQFPYYLIDPRKRRPPIEDGRNPMLVREARWGAMTRGSGLVRTFYVSFAVYFFVAAAAIFDADSGQDVRGWIVTQIVLTLCIAPGLLANALTKERELGNFDMLRMTLLSPREIVVGKLFAGGVTLMPVLGAAILSIIPIGYWGGVPVNVVALGYGSLVVCAAMALSLSMLASLFATRSSASIAMAYGMVLAAVMGVYLAVRAAVRWYANYAGLQLDRYELEAYVDGISSYFSPVATYQHAAQFSRSQGYDVDYSYWVAGSLAALAVSFLVTGFVVRFFERRRMQDI